MIHVLYQPNTSNQNTKILKTPPCLLSANIFTILKEYSMPTLKPITNAEILFKKYNDL
jgi:hypothetical protein